MFEILLPLSFLAWAFGYYWAKRQVRHGLAECRKTLAANELEIRQYIQKIEVLDDLLTLKEAENKEIQSRADQILLNILPAPIIQRLKAGEQMIADNLVEVTVLFADIVGFTQIAADIPPAEVVDLLNRVFSLFDIFSEQYAVEKIKTIGDAYMIVGGAPEPREEHTEAVADMALEIQTTISLLAYSLNVPVQVRIGIHTGPAVAGIIGKKKFSYDLWGDTVNTASRLESHGEPGKVHVSEAVYQKLKNTYIFQERGTIEIKGKGQMSTFFLIGKQDT